MRVYSITNKKVAQNIMKKGTLYPYRNVLKNSALFKFIAIKRIKVVSKVNIPREIV